MTPHKRMASAQKRNRTQQSGRSNVEIDEACPLNDLAHPNRRAQVFREGVRLVLEYEKDAKFVERETDTNCPIPYEYTEELTSDEARLVSEKSFECYTRRARGRCPLISCVKVEAV